MYSSRIPKQKKKNTILLIYSSINSLKLNLFSRAAIIKEKEIIPAENSDSFIKKIEMFCSKKLLSSPRNEEPVASHDDILEFDDVMIPIENLEKTEEDLSLLLLDDVNYERHNEREKICSEAQKQDPQNQKSTQNSMKNVNIVQSKKTKKKSVMHSVSPENESDYFNPNKQTQIQTKRSQVEFASNANWNCEQEENDHQAKKMYLDNNLKPNNQNTIRDEEYYGAGEKESSRRNLEETASNGSFESQYCQYNAENKFVDDKPTANSEYEGNFTFHLLISFRPKVRPKFLNF